MYLYDPFGPLCELNIECVRFSGLLLAAAHSFQGSYIDCFWQT